MRYALTVTLVLVAIVLVFTSVARPASEQSLYLPIVIGGSGIAPSPTPTVTEGPTGTPSETPTEGPTWTPTETVTEGPTNTATSTWTPSPTYTQTHTPTNTPTYTHTPTFTSTPTLTRTPTSTHTPTPTKTATPYGDLRISCLSYSGSREYVCITNGGTGSQTMTGWKLLSVVGSQQYSFPSGYVLAAGDTVRVISGPDATNAPPSDLFWTTTYIWNNDGDEARLINNSGTVVDTWSY